MISQNDIQKLADAKIFKRGSRDKVVRWLGAIPGYSEEFSPGQVIHMQGDRYDRLILLIEGTADARFQDLSGKVMRIESLTGPEAVASAVLFSSDQVLPVTLTAETRVRLFRIRRSVFLELLLRDPQLLENMLMDIGDRLVFLAEKVRFIRFANLRQKIAGYLLQIEARTKTDELKLGYTREKLAEMFGVERPSLSRELSKMDEEGLIRVEGRTAWILDREALMECLEQ